MGIESLRITTLLSRSCNGDTEADHALFELVFQQLREIATRHVRREHSPAALQPTELVNEAYLRFKSSAELQFGDRRQFFAFASSVIRRVLVDQARRRDIEARAKEVLQIGLARRGDEVLYVATLDLEEALEELQRLDPWLARIAELRIFGRLEAKEIAEQVGKSSRTVERKWGVARTWLVDRFSESPTVHDSQEPA